MLFEGETGGGGGEGATGAAPVAADWFTKVTDADQRGWLENKGLHLKPADEVLALALKGYQSAEKMTGVPHERLVALPKDLADEAGWIALRAKLGVPTDPKEYTFEDVKRGDQPIAEPDAEYVRGLAAQLHLPKDRAGDLAKAIIKREEDARIETVAAAASKLTAEKEKLGKQWGDNFAANTAIAQNAASTVMVAAGMQPEDIVSVREALEKTVGYATTMEMFRVIGTKTGEARFVSNGNPLNGGLMTAEAAQARLNELKADKAFVTRYFAKDAAAMREMDDLHKIIWAAK